MTSGLKAMIVTKATWSSRAAHPQKARPWRGRCRLASIFTIRNRGRKQPWSSMGSLHTTARQTSITSTCAKLFSTGGDQCQSLFRGQRGAWICATPRLAERRGPVRGRNRLQFALTILTLNIIVIILRPKAGANDGGAGRLDLRSLLPSCAHLHIERKRWGGGQRLVHSSNHLSVVARVWSVVAIP